MSPDSIPAMKHQLLPSNMAPALTSLTEPTRIRFQKKKHIPTNHEKYSRKPFSDNHRKIIIDLIDQI